MTEPLPPPRRHCPACGRGHHAPVPFCPFCGAAQAVTVPRDAPGPPPALPESARPISFHLDPQPTARPVVRVAPMPVATPAPPAPPPRTAKRLKLRSRRSRPGWRRPILALLAIAALSALALARRESLPAPSRITVGQDWIGVALEPLAGTPLVRFTGDGPFSLRLDGERVLRVAPGSGASLRTKTLRGLELRAAKGSVTVTLTPRRE